MNNFVSIDFETANGNRSSVCSVGMVIVKDGQTVDSFYSLICPTPNYYAWFCQQVHGLSASDTDRADSFPAVWAQALEKIRHYFPDFEQGTIPFVAHNAAFDSSCLRAAFAAYEMGEPAYPFLCTLTRSRQVWSGGSHTLDVIAAYCGYDLQNHHHALADAEACAAIAQEIL